MEGFEPCPSCGIPVRLHTMFLWTRLVTLCSSRCIRSRMLPAPDYGTMLQVMCPACRATLTFPFDAPTVTA